MLQKTFINLSKAAYNFIEGSGLAGGTVFDYPLAELDDLITGKVIDKAVAEYVGLPPHSVVRVLAVNSDNSTSKVLELGFTI
jgi:hypothetical protein